MASASSDKLIYSHTHHTYHTNPKVSHYEYSEQYLVLIVRTGILLVRTVYTRYAVSYLGVGLDVCPHRANGRARQLPPAGLAVDAAAIVLKHRGHSTSENTTSPQQQYGQVAVLPLF